MGTKRPWRIEVKGPTWAGWWTCETRGNREAAVARCEHLQANGYHHGARVIHRETGEIAAQWPKPEPVVDVADLAAEMLDLHSDLMRRAAACVPIAQWNLPAERWQRLKAKRSAYNHAAELLRGALERCGVDLD